MNTLNTFLESIDSQKAETPPEPITKVEAIRLVENKGERIPNRRTGIASNPDGYTNATCRVLKAIIHAIKAPDRHWQTFNIHSNEAVCAADPKRLAAKAQCSLEMFYRAVKTLSGHGIVIRCAEGYRVNLVRLNKLDSKHYVEQMRHRNRLEYWRQRYQDTKGKTQETT